MQTENARLKSLIAHQDAANDELDRLRQEARDVLRLRNEVTLLHDVQQQNQQLMMRLYQLSNEVQTAIQTASEWRNYQQTANSGTLSNGSTELGRQPGEIAVGTALPGNQLTGTQPADIPQDLETATQLLSEFGAMTPGTSAAPDKGNGSMSRF